MSFVFTTPDMMCDGCANSIKKGLSKQAGVKNVTTDVAAKTVTVDAGADVSRDQLVAALTKIGFPPKQ